MLDEIKLLQFKEKMKLFGYAVRSVEGYAAEVRRFFCYLEEKENLKSILDAESSHLKAWQAHICFGKFRDNKPLTPGTLLTRLVAVKTFFRIMHQENLYPHNYAPCIIMPKKRRPLPRNIPTVDEMRRLLQAVVPDNPLGIRNRFMLELLYATGIRSEELRTRSVQDLSIQEKTLFVHGKGAKDRVVPLGNWVIPYALEYLHAARPYLVRLTKTNLLFPTINGFMLDSSCLHKLIKAYRIKAGITMNISPHTFRHACATHMLAAGADIRYVQELLGHSDLSSTQIYTKVTIGDLKLAHAKYHPANQQDF